MSRSRSAAASRLHDSAPVFAALGDETRLQIVARLCAEGPLSMGQDAGLIHDSPPAADVVRRIAQEADEILSRRLPKLLARVV